MFGNLVALHKDKHKDLRFTPRTDHGHAAAERWVPVVSAEFEAASQEHVLVFAPEAGGLPLLLTGLQAARNAYVDAQGQWRAGYVPARLRHYPFGLIERPAQANASEAQRSFLLGLVPQAPHFAGAEGVALIGDDGAWAPLLDKAQRALVAMQADAERTQFMAQQLEDAGLLTTAVVPVFFSKDAREGSVTIRGLRMLNVEAFKALTDSQRAALSASGALGLVQAHLHSLRNLAGGPLGEAARALAAEGGAAVSAAPGGKFLDPEALAAARADAGKRPAPAPVQPSAQGLFAGLASTK